MSGKAETRKHMLPIKIHGVSNVAILRELIDEFISPAEYEIIEDDGFFHDDCLHINAGLKSDKDAIKREIFNALNTLTGVRPDWGILTGVRPVKLAGELIESLNSREAAQRTLRGRYMLTEEKAKLITDTYGRQNSVYGKPKEDSVGVYIGIPFCPTRCLYCSFTSNQADPEEIEAYLEALKKEIGYVAEKLKANGQHPETLYFGGGTPTTLSADQLKRVLDEVKASFDFCTLREFTVEAGRPDTIDEEKLDVLQYFGVDRISINPQSMKEETLKIIGRGHSPEDIRRAFEIAGQRNFKVINADLIAGLPGETRADFLKTLEEVVDLGANNVTIHTLSVKRGSGLKNVDENYHYTVADVVSDMLAGSREILTAGGFVPYYLYRQKHMAGFFENTGYCLGETDGLYNIRIMDEHQTVIALGAGGISKRYYPETDRLVRIPNVSNYREYINRIDEMCDRKEKKLWSI